MIKVKKYFSLLVIVFFILSNIAFAQSTSSNSGFNENKNSNEEIQSKEKDIMERFMKGDASEDEMSAMMKAKMGAKFSEEEFQKAMMELKEKRNRKDTFSYEHEGFEGYNAGPSYEGYSKEHIIFGKVFEHIGDDIDPRDIKEYCNDPNKIADIVISKLKERIGDLQKICSEFDDNEAKCNEIMKNNCARLGTMALKEGATEMGKMMAAANACPVDKDAIIETCKAKYESYMEQRMQNTEKSCQENFDFGSDRLGKEWEKFKENLNCDQDKDKFVSQCMDEIKNGKGGKTVTPKLPTLLPKPLPCIPKIKVPCPTCVYCEKGAVYSINPDTCCIECRRISLFPSPCPESAHPLIDACPFGDKLVKKTDENGCIYNVCEPCPPATRSCPPGTYPILWFDTSGCYYYTCCPESDIPKCKEYQVMVYDGSKDGCDKYHCQDPGCPSGERICPNGWVMHRVPPSCNFPSCPSNCPPEPEKPVCKTDELIYPLYDDKGCIDHYTCLPRGPCPSEPEKPICPEGQVPHAVYDYKYCIESYYCIPLASVSSSKTTTYPSTNYSSTTPTCPQSPIPTCPESQTVQKKVDANGCVYYYCETTATATTATRCPEVSKPTCTEGQSLIAKYDSNKCIVGYECVSTTTTTTSPTANSCPTAQIPTCAAGTTLQKKTDANGCVYYYCETVTATTSTQSNNTITGVAVYANAGLKTYDDYVAYCEKSWTGQQSICSKTPATCKREDYIEKCKEQEQKNIADYSAKIGQHCESDIISQIKYAEQRCSKIEEERKRCIEQSAKRCGQTKGLAQQCRDTLTEDKLRNFIVEEAKKRCKFSDIIENEDEVKKSEKAEVILAVLNTATQSDFDKLKLFVDNLEEDLKLQDTTVYKGTIEPNRFGDLKLLPFVVNAKLNTVESSERAKEVKAKIVAGQKAENAASKLVSLRDSDVPKEYLYIIEDKASDVLNVSDNLEELEKREGQKGLGYKIRLFLGLAKAAEKEEIKQLEESKSKLTNSIETLAKLVDEVPSDVAKAVLKEQVENLKKQQQDIEVLIQTKEKKSKGLLGLFG